MWRALFAACVLSAAAALRVDKSWVEHFYGRVKGDGYEYFAIDVPPGVYLVELLLVLSELGPRTPPVLYLKHDAFPTETSFDLQINTSLASPYISTTLTNIKIGRQYITVWGGNIHGSVTTFGVGPSQIMWWYLDLTFHMCLDLDAFGSSCQAPRVAIASSKTSNGGKNGSATTCLDLASSVKVFSFELTQPWIDLTVQLTSSDPNVKWGLYLDAANPLASDSVAVQNGTAATNQFHVTRPQTGTWLVVVKTTSSRGSCAQNGGTKITVAFLTQPCTSVDGFCTVPANTTTLNELRNAAYPTDDYIIHAAFNSFQATPPSSQLQAYELELSPLYTGSTVILHMAATVNLIDFVIYIRVDGWPSDTLYDYTFNASQTMPINPVGLSDDPTKSTVVSFDVLRNQTNGTIVVVEFPPILFPKPGHWYIIVRPTKVDTLVKSSWNAALQLRTAACPTHNTCSDRGTCVVKTSYQGFVYGECLCTYGYGGRDCSTNVYSNGERLGRTLLLLLSNGAILPAAVLSWTRKLYVEAVLFASLGVISGVYHACDMNLYCVLPYKFLQTMDFAFTFNAIMMGFIHLSGAFKHAAMQVFVLVALIFMTAFNATTMKNWLAVGIVILVQFISTWTYYLALAKHRLGVSVVETLHRFLFQSDNFDVRFLCVGVVLWGSAFGCFFVESGQSYWLIHSIWHCTAMLAACAFMGVRKNNRYRCIRADGQDVLSHDATDAARTESRQKSLQKDQVILPLHVKQVPPIQST
ncbi:hypothetical protein LEN26_008059 [Aphanomyces euteiches]|nr:hypothetical protein AeMF1_004668 [Aphanomyces euteiches]KAH9130938.1 hypothetical protein LEN26_008059 [Aphanomyces euteiches]KAH9186071.1 hypothetical protein AeNC1_011950 [Aphanomyces euteiches]